MTLLISKYPYTRLSRETVNGKRMYCCPDGSKVASVTTILDKTKPAKDVAALAAWRRRVGPAKAQEISTEASSRGTRMHKYIENYIQTGDRGEPGTNPYSKQSFAMASEVIQHGLSNFSEIYGVEINLCYPGLYAGTTDGAGMHLNEECIFDHKQSNKLKQSSYVDDYRMQVVAYALAHNKLYGSDIKKGIITICTADFQYQEFIVTPDEFDHWAGQWWDRVELYYQNNQ